MFVVFLLVCCVVAQMTHEDNVGLDSKRKDLVEVESSATREKRTFALYVGRGHRPYRPRYRPNYGIYK